VAPGSERKREWAVELIQDNRTEQKLEEREISQSDLVRVPEVVSKREEGRVVELGSGQCARDLEVACQQLACWCGGRSEGRWQEKVVVRWPAWPFSHFPFLEFLQPLNKLIQGKARENL
jgi:hypothetical protein